MSHSDYISTLQTIPNLQAYQDQRIPSDRNFYQQPPFESGINDAISTPIAEGSPTVGTTIDSIVSALYVDASPTILTKVFGTRYLTTPPTAEAVCRMLLTQQSGNSWFREKDPRFTAVYTERIKLDLDQPGSKAKLYARETEQLQAKLRRRSKPSRQSLNDVLGENKVPIVTALLNAVDEQNLPYWMNYVFETFHRGGRESLYFPDGARNPLNAPTYTYFTYHGWAWSEVNRV